MEPKEIVKTSVSIKKVTRKKLYVLKRKLNVKSINEVILVLLKTYNAI